LEIQDVQEKKGSERESFNNSKKEKGKPIIKLKITGKPRKNFGEWRIGKYLIKGKSKERVLTPGLGIRRSKALKFFKKRKEFWDVRRQLERGGRGTGKWWTLISSHTWSGTQGEVAREEKKVRGGWISGCRLKAKTYHEKGKTCRPAEGEDRHTQLSLGMEWGGNAFQPRELKAASPK